VCLCAQFLPIQATIVHVSRCSVRVNESYACCRKYSHFSFICSGYVGAEFAIPLLERMRETKIAPDLPTYSKLLDVCSRAAVHRNAGIADVSRIFSQLAHDGLAPNTMTLNAMLKVRKSLGSPWLAWCCRSSGINLTVVWSSQVCARLACHGDACILDAFEIFQWCLDSGIVLLEPQVIQRQGGGDEAVRRAFDQDVRAYASMEQVLALTKALSEIELVDIVTYNTLMEICAKSALVGAANFEVKPRKQPHRARNMFCSKSSTGSCCHDLTCAFPGFLG
jgi:hypothetical protein